MRKQYLTPTAARMKAIRDKRYAMKKDRKSNRGNFGNGTKNEG